MAYAGEELNLNLIVWPESGGVAEHANREVEVLLVGMQGEGLVLVDDQPYPIEPGSLLLIPKGASRSIEARSGGFAYLSIHRRRAGLQPIRRAGTSPTTDRSNG